MYIIHFISVLLGTTSREHAYNILKRFPENTHQPGMLGVWNVWNEWKVGIMYSTVYPIETNIINTYDSKLDTTY